jgi:DNA-binding protein H-NS
VEIPKDKIIEMLRERGAEDKIQQAEQELPDQVDPEQHREQLQKLGIDPSDLLGGIGDRLGL